MQIFYPFLEESEQPYGNSKVYLPQRFIIVLYYCIIVLKANSKSPIIGPKELNGFVPGIIFLYGLLFLLYCDNTKVMGQ